MGQELNIRTCLTELVIDSDRADLGTDTLCESLLCDCGLEAAIEDCFLDRNESTRLLY